MSDRRHPTKTSANPPPHARPKQIGIRLPADLGERLESIARAEHNGVSSVVRRLLVAALAAHGDGAA